MISALIAALHAPFALGFFSPNVELVFVLLLLKLFDAWSTNYIVGRKKGFETMSLSAWLIRKTGNVQLALAIDFALVAVAAWLCYPFWYFLGGLVAWYAYWMALQVREVKKSRPS